VGWFAGLLAVLGMGSLRFADDCVRVGARGARGVDDVAVVGGRTGGSLDELGHGSLSRVGQGFDDAARPRLVIHPGAAVGEEGHWLESLREFAIEAGFEVASYEFDEPAIRPPRIEAPLAIDLDQDAWAWSRLDSDESTAPGPWIFSGRAQGDALIVGDQRIAIRELAEVCRRRNTTCVFVACASNCARRTEALFQSSRPLAHSPIDPYVAQFVAARLGVEPKPLFVAIAAGELTVLRANSR
jgi:hypothetical protein